MKIFNTLTREKEELVPIKQGEINIYACDGRQHDADAADDGPSG